MKTMPSADELTMLCTALECVGLPADPRQVIGRMFQFTYEDEDSPKVILVGTITAVSVNGIRSVTLFISNPFHLDGILRIVAHQRATAREQTPWFLLVRSEKRIKELRGELILL